ncbi:hypothetical protein R0G64_32215, partial [Pseudomonas otitidis]
SIKLKDAMFCFLGSWLYGAPESVGSGGKVFQKTNYAVEELILTKIRNPEKSMSCSAPGRPVE